MKHSVILAKSYDHDCDFNEPPRSQMLVIDPLSHILGFYRHCSDIDHDIPRQVNCDLSVITRVDFKVREQPSEDQIILLNEFLHNPQPHKLLHVALYHDASSEFLRDITWHADKIVLDLHDYHSQCSAGHRADLHRRLPLTAYTYVDYFWHDCLFFDLKKLGPL